MSADIADIRRELEHLSRVIATTEEVAGQSVDDFAWRVSLDGLRARREQLYRELQSELDKAPSGRVGVTGEVLGAMHAALETAEIDNFQRLLLYLHYWYDVPLTEIGEAFGISEASVRILHGAALRAIGRTGLLEGYESLGDDDSDRAAVEATQDQATSDATGRLPPEMRRLADLIGSVGGHSDDASRPKLATALLGPVGTQLLRRPP